ncbi:MAG: spermidine/putrescine ABC transporter substrate-binding protein [Bdellovibrio sp.]|nr:MAG: spermidine/putrescine ABC transporter substrate-binding protein [Bdellovibrio sp.]
MTKSTPGSVRSGFKARPIGRALIPILSCLLLLNGACTPKSGVHKDGRTVNLAIWGNYLDPEDEKRFTQQTGIKLNITNYSSNEELLAKVQAGASGIDVAVPSDYMVGVMIKLGLLEPLKSDLIPNIAELDPQFLKQSYDPTNTFSLPYAWTTTGLAVHKDLVRTPVKGWKDVISNADLDGKISLLDDKREVMAVAAKINRFPVNTTDDQQLAQIKKTLLDLHKKVKMFRSDTVDPLVGKEITVAHAYSGDTLQAWRKTHGKVEYVFPEEGGTWGIDNVVIFKNSSHLEEAHALINFFFQPETNVNFVKRMLAGPVVMKTKALLPSELQNLAALFPPPAAMAKLEKIQDLGEKNKDYDRIWTEVRAR